MAEATSTHPEGPSTQHFRTPVPKTIRGMAFGTRNRKYWVLGPSGTDNGLLAARQQSKFLGDVAS